LETAAGGAAEWHEANRSPGRRKAAKRKQVCPRLPDQSSKSQTDAAYSVLYANRHSIRGGSMPQTDFSGSLVTRGTFCLLYWYAFYSSYFYFFNCFSINTINGIIIATFIIPKKTNAVS
jgi:hypothetical protein